jgi:tRNA1Val (adenine37-N6)-methyltransferase
VGNNYFHFKQFTIHHDRCAMKVGTDGVVLGAWAPLPEEGRVLDIGTGSGLMALMMAQRGRLLHVTGIDIDAEAVLQARENVAASPFADRVAIDHLSLQELMSDASQASAFDAIVCNPPFFESSLLPPDAQRALARHTTSLPFNELIQGARLLLRSGGLFSVILPTDSFDEFRRLCFVESLYVKAAVLVQTSARKTPKRVMACFVKDEIQEATTDTLILTEAGTRSADYRRLTDDFYLY